MHRRQQDYLDQWYRKKTRKPLVIRGARQVGKSTLVRQFCQARGIKLYEVNLERQTQLNQVFAEKNPRAAIEAIEDILKTKLKAGAKSLLFLDEVQATPMALPCLRYFYEELPEFPVIAAGSLLEFTLSDHEFSMPVGRIEYLYMGPVSFEEFLLARKETFLMDRIAENTKDIRSFKPLSDSLHKRGLELLREYLFVGGMPEAIQVSLDHGIEAVPAIHAQILQTYKDDFVKYAKKTHLDKIQKVFQFVFLNPCQKVKYSNISKEDLSRDLKANLNLLTQARVLHQVPHASCNGLPLKASEDPLVFKTLALDVGLVNSAHGLSWSSFKNYGENEILIEGAIAEQFVGQHLLDQRPLFQEPHLNYWLREGKSHNAEVDYVLERDSRIIAIEVKSGAAGKIRSLHQWMLECKYKKKMALRFNLSPGEITTVTHRYQNTDLKYELLTLPLYMIQAWEPFAEGPLKNNRP